MGAYILRRLLLIIPTLLGIMALNFVIIQFAPGGPVERIVFQIQEGEAGSATERFAGTGDAGTGGEAGAGGVAHLGVGIGHGTGELEAAAADAADAGAVGPEEHAAVEIGHGRRWRPGTRGGGDRAAVEIGRRWRSGKRAAVETRHERRWRPGQASVWDGVEQGRGGSEQRRVQGAAYSAGSFFFFGGGMGGMRGFSKAGRTKGKVKVSRNGLKRRRMACNSPARFKAICR